MNHCKTIADLCESLDYLSYTSQEESLVCNICVKNFDPSILGSKEIIQSILKKENMALFRNGKVIIHLICVACVKVSVESVVEILVSRYEKLFDSSRQPTEQHSVFTKTYRTTFFGQSHHF